MMIARRLLSRSLMSHGNRFLASLREKAGQLDPLSLYEPKIEDSRLFPEYPLINIQMQSYDYVPLEKFQSYVHRTAKRFSFNVVESFAVASQTERIVTFRKHTTYPESEIVLDLYDRTIKIANVPSVHLDLFLSLIQAHMPIGIRLIVKEHEKADDHRRYIPDVLLVQKQTELKSLDDVNVRRALGWE